MNEVRRDQLGAVGELTAAAHLISLGYYVFRAVADHSPFDLIAYRDGLALRVEVKTAFGWGKNGCTPPWPRNDEWDLLAVVTEDHVFVFEATLPRDEACRQMREYYHRPPTTPRPPRVTQPRPPRVRRPRCASHTPGWLTVPQCRRSG